jgi:thioester reductase-like protein
MSAIRPSGQTARCILLTGATGFVGRFLLSQLLEDTDATIYCLIRASSRLQAALRIKTNLSAWDLWHSRYEHRIVAIPGDLRLPRLGIGGSDYRIVTQAIDSIYHCGASVNHLETYERAKAANVTATEDLLRIATQQTAKPIHYVSTLGIFTDPDHTGKRVVYEDTAIDKERHRQSTGYLTSKWVAECLLMKARDQGHPCNIFRLGLLWADSRHGRFDDLQHVYRLIKSALIARSAPENYHFNQDPIPVDYAARAIVALSEEHHAKQANFHLTSSAQAPEGLFERCNRALEAPLSLMPLYDWIQEIKRLHRSGQSLPIAPLFDFVFRMDRRQFAEHLELSARAHVHASCAQTSAELMRLGIDAPPNYHDLLPICLQGMAAHDAELADSSNFNPAARRTA